MLSGLLGVLSVSFLGTAFGVVGTATGFVLSGGAWVLKMVDQGGRVLSRGGSV